RAWSSSHSSCVHLCAGTAGQGKEDVVEVRGVHRELLDLDRVRIELVEQASYRFRPTVAGDAEGQVLLAVPARVGQDPHRGVEFEVTGEPEPDVTARDLALELAGSAVRDHAALVEHRDPVREPVGLVEVLGGQEDGDAVGHQPADDVPHGAAAARVESGRRLVQEDDPRVADQGHRQVELPAHATGVGRDQLLRRLRQVEPLQQSGDDAAALVRAEAREIRHQLEVLPTGQQLVHGRELTGDADDRAYRLGLGHDVVPGDGYRPAVGFRQRGQHV